MAYTKHVWASGDVISSNALNEMEEGIVSALPAANFNIIGGARGQEDALDSSNTSNTETASTQYVASYVNKTIEGMNTELTNNDATKTITSLTQSQGKITATFTDIPAATTTSKGLVQIGNNLAVADGVISADYKTEGDYNSNSNKLITNSAMGSAISTAISNIQSNINVGNNEIITGLEQVNGVVSVTSTSVPVASDSSFGFVKIGSGITINSNGEISVLTNTDGTINLDSLTTYYGPRPEEETTPLPETSVTSSFKTLYSIQQNSGLITATFTEIPDARIATGDPNNNGTPARHGLISAEDITLLHDLDDFLSLPDPEDNTEYFFINSNVSGRKGWTTAINNFSVNGTLKINNTALTAPKLQALLAFVPISEDETEITSNTLKLGNTTLNETELQALKGLLNNNNGGE